LQPLVGQDPETGAYDESGLARSWEHNEDFTTWTSHLHEDAEFHFDWGPVTAADVVRSYKLHTADDSTLIGVAILRGAELEVIDDHTVAFHLPEPRPNYLFAHAGRGSLHIYSKAQFDAEVLEGYDARPAGSGELQYVERVPGRGVVFEKVEGHWSGQEARYDELNLRFVQEASTAALKAVRVAAPEHRVKSYPHQMSGGMKQRVVGAIAISGRPKVIIADEPTTALDVTIQLQYLKLLEELQAETGMGILFITHDFGIVARLCDRIVVMYGGRIVESGPTEVVFDHPSHPYTEALLASVPTVERKVERLYAIEGQPPSLTSFGAGCRFAPRCPHAMPRCRVEVPPSFPGKSGQGPAVHIAACWLLEPRSQPEMQPAGQPAEQPQSGAGQ
jgi:oligopeptide/dipeptide ABC transporter ATP-binding protein